MADSTPRPAAVSVDRLGAVREWLWRHSSQPNGDPWDSDPEHLDWAAQHLLNDLAEQLIGGDPGIRTVAPDAGLTCDRLEVTASAPLLSWGPRHAGHAKEASKAARGTP